MRKTNRVSKWLARALSLVMAMSVLFSIGYITSNASEQNQLLCRGYCGSQEDCGTTGECVCGASNFCVPWPG